MKLTWFGNRTFRIHAGGQILVVEAEGAPEGVDRNELVSGADRLVGFADDLPVAAGAEWKPRPSVRLLDAGETLRPVQLWSLGSGTLLLDADEDMPLLLLAGPVPTLGRWVERAVVVLAGPHLAARAEVLSGTVSPRLLALAGTDTELDAAFAVWRDHAEGGGVMALEPGMAVEA